MRVPQRLAILSVITAIVAIGCAGADDASDRDLTTTTTAAVAAPVAATSSSTTTSMPSTTTTIPEPTTTTTVYVGSVTAVFDGEACTSDGPSEFVVGKRLQWILQNDAPDGVVAYGLWKVLDGTTPEDIADAGVEAVAEGPTRILLDWFERNSAEGAAEPGDRLSWPSPLDEVGTWAVVCVTEDNEYPALIVEVLES